MRRAVLYGVSMGGNMSGLALAARPKRKDGTPLFDTWVAVEPAVNVTETYLEARLVGASGNAYAVGAAEDIERETGGPIESRREAFAQRTVVNRVPDIVASGVRGVVLVHGVADGLVPYNQSRELYTLLRASGVRASYTTFTTHSAASEAGTTLDGYAGAGQPSPFAGHGDEESLTNDVIRESFAGLNTVLRGGPSYRVPCRETLVDGASGTRTSAPDGCS